MADQRFELYAQSHPDGDTIEDFFVYIGRLRTMWPEWRSGQTWYNALDRARPELAHRIIGSELDPFHNDKNIAGLRAWLKMNWNS